MGEGHGVVRFGSDRVPCRPLIPGKRAKPPRRPRALREPCLVCPFFGEELVIEFSPGTGSYFARGRFYTTRLFPSRDELLWFLSHQAGVPPTFPREGPRLVITEKEPPLPEMPDPGLPLDHYKERVKEIVTR